MRVNVHATNMDSTYNCKAAENMINPYVCTSQAWMWMAGCPQHGCEAQNPNSSTPN